MTMQLSSLSRQLINRIRFGGPKRLYRNRAELAAKFVRGSGLEIGALHHPLEVLVSVEVLYVDRLSTQDLITHYPELDPDSIVHVDIIEDGETLASIPDASQDFVIANHLLEHCQDPIGTLENWLRVLHEDGVIFLSVPDKRYTFDYSRSLTELSHVIRDWHDGPEWSRMLHYEEWVRFVDRVPEEQILSQVEALAPSNISIHFHVWTANTFRELLGFCEKNLKFNFEVCKFMRNGIENIAIIKRLE